MSAGDRIDICKVCLVCLKTTTKMHKILDSDNVKDHQITKHKDKTPCLKTMLEFCLKYKLENANYIPKLICDICEEQLRIVYAFHFKCQESYNKLKSFLRKSTTTAATTIEEEINLDLKESENTTEKKTQTNQSACSISSRVKDPSDESSKTLQGNGVSCRFCNKPFSRIIYLKKHLLKVHTQTEFLSEFPYLCSLCDEYFMKESLLREHLSFYHELIEPISTADPNEELDQDDVDEVRQQKNTIDDCSNRKQDAKPDRNPMQLENEFVVLNEDEEIHENLNYEDISNGSSYISVGTDIFENEDHENNLENIENKSDDEDIDNNEVEADDVNNAKKNFMEVLMEDEVLISPTFTQMQNSFPLDQNSIEEENPFELNDKPVEDETQTETKKQTPKKTKASKLGKKGRGRPPKSSSINIKEHSGSSLTSPNLTNVSEVEVEKTHKCLECDKDFSSYSKLQSHKSLAHKNQTFSCPKCSKKFKTKIYLQRHMERHNTRRFICKECSERYETKEELSAHVKLKGHDKPLLCPECGLRCKTTNILLVHLRRHKGEKPFKCKFCDKGFPRIDDLKIHEKYHTNEKSHFCETCGKGFQRKYNLKIHMRVHTGEKPYKCPHCPQAFTQGNDLKAHIRRHTGERFRCEICGDGFLQVYQIRNHKLREHGIKEEPPTKRVAKFTSPEAQEKQIKQINQKQQDQGA